MKNGLKEMARIVSLKPGTSGEKGIHDLLEDDFSLDDQTTVSEVIDYVLERATKNRSSERIVERVNAEMSNAYAIISNGKTVTKKDKALPLFVDASKDDQAYLQLDLIVASHQEGGRQYF